MKNCVIVSAVRVLLSVVLTVHCFSLNVRFLDEVIMQRTWGKIRASGTLKSGLVADSRSIKYVVPFPPAIQAGQAQSIVAGVWKI